MGDPAGCGPQITAKAWQVLRQTEALAFAVIADARIFSGLCDFVEVQSPGAAPEIFRQAMPIIPLNSTHELEVVPGQPDLAAASAIIQSIEMATRLCLRGEASALVTNPISKELLYKAGFSHPGHTEFLASLCSEGSEPITTPVMMLVGGGLRVALATIHMPLMQVGSHLTTELLVDVARKTAKALAHDFGLPSPRLAFTGLNPHAGENGTIGREEVDIINPAAAILREEGIAISDARPADTVFHESLEGRFDGIIAMTHDQGLIPVKTLDIWGGVNTTLGLPIIRTSPDHGTAYDAAREGTCRPDSLIAAIKLARSMAGNRAAVHA